MDEYRVKIKTPKGSVSVSADSMKDLYAKTMNAMEVFMVDEGPQKLEKRELLLEGKQNEDN